MPQQAHAMDRISRFLGELDHRYKEYAAAFVQAGCSVPGEIAYCEHWEVPSISAESFQRIFAAVKAHNRKLLTVSNGRL